MPLVAAEAHARARACALGLEVQRVPRVGGGRGARACALRLDVQRQGAECRRLVAAHACADAPRQSTLTPLVGLAVATQRADHDRRADAGDRGARRSARGRHDREGRGEDRPCDGRDRPPPPRLRCRASRCDWPLGTVAGHGRWTAVGRSWGRWAVRSVPGEVAHQSPGRAPTAAPRTDVEESGPVEVSLDVRRGSFLPFVQLPPFPRRLLGMIDHNTTISPSTARTTGCVSL